MAGDTMPSAPRTLDKVIALNQRWGSGIESDPMAVVGEARLLRSTGSLANYADLLRAWLYIDAGQLACEASVVAEGIEIEILRTLPSRGLDSAQVTQ